MSVPLLGPSPSNLGVDRRLVETSKMGDNLLVLKTALVQQIAGFYVPALHRQDDRSNAAACIAVTQVTKSKYFGSLTARPAWSP